jgi:iron complex transport system substrate-binding protein
VNNPMRRAVVIVVAAVAVMMAVAAGGCGKAGGTREGARVKIVTLTPSATEVVAALGSQAQLVGVDEYSTFPPEVAGLPKVGSFLAPNFEAIVRLQPGLVIADDIHADAAAALRGVGIEVMTIPMHALPDLQRAFETVGARLGRRAAAAERRAEIETAIAGARARKVGRGRRVLIVIDREPGGLGAMIAAANGSWMDELVAITGAQNVLAGSAVRYPKLSAEEIIRAQPDVILDVSYAAEEKTAVATWRSRPELAGVPAIASGRIRVLKAPYFLGPSPRVPAALLALEAALAAGE